MSGVALLHHSFGPYHFARTRAFEQRHPGPLHLLELAAGERLREWRRDAETARVRSAVPGLLEDSPPREIARGVRRLLDDARPDAIVIAGYAHAGMREAARWAREHRVAAVLLSDSHSVDKPRWRIKETAKALWVRAHFQTAFTAGAEGAVYLRTLGFARDRIWRGYDVIDNAAFSSAADRARASAEEVRRRRSLPERFFLYVGRFAKEKNLQTLLSAFERFSITAKDRVDLVLAGGGPLEAELRAQVTKLKLADRVHLPGFVQQEELAELYACALALTLPSTTEPWGLVVNEAMACGLPVIASTHCGCALDLVLPGFNGYLFEPSDTAALQRAMEQLSSDEKLRASMGQRSRQLISTWSPELWADSLADCVRAARRVLE